MLGVLIVIYILIGIILSALVSIGANKKILIDKESIIFILTWPRLFIGK